MSKMKKQPIPQGTYTVPVLCTNCGFREKNMEIKLGTRISEVRCPQCKCDYQLGFDYTHNMLVGSI